MEELPERPRSRFLRTTRVRKPVTASWLSRHSPWPLRTKASLMLRPDPATPLTRA